MADPHNEVIVLCLLVDGPLILPDNLVTTCSACGRQVRANADALTVAGVLDRRRDTGLATGGWSVATVSAIVFVP